MEQILNNIKQQQDGKIKQTNHYFFNINTWWLKSLIFFYLFKQINIFMERMYLSVHIYGNILRPYLFLWFTKTGTIMAQFLTIVLKSTS